MTGPWLVTVPYGTQLSSSWSCCQCSECAEPGVLPAGQARAEAAEHVKSAGHVVSVYRGTAELLVPLATAPPAPKELAT